MLFSWPYDIILELKITVYVKMIDAIVARSFLYVNKMVSNNLYQGYIYINILILEIKYHMCF